jgi:hypothetical protein
MVADSVIVYEFVATMLRALFSISEIPFPQFLSSLKILLRAK